MTKIERSCVVYNRILFAERRLEDLTRLNNGDLAGANPVDRQQLIQKFFFHLVGAIDFLAQDINIQKDLGIPPENVNARVVFQKLKENDPIKHLIGCCLDTILISEDTCWTGTYDLA